MQCTGEVHIECWELGFEQLLSKVDIHRSQNNMLWKYTLYEWIYCKTVRVTCWTANFAFKST